MTEQDYIDYWKDLAAKHKKILHTEQRPRFYVQHDKNRAELEQKFKTATWPAVMIDAYADDLDRTADNFREVIMGGVSILVQCRGNDPADVRRARDEARAIARSFINRMVRDCRTGSLKPHKITPSTRFEGEPLEVLRETITGWGYPFDWTLPTSVAVNADDWSDL